MDKLKVDIRYGYNNPFLSVCIENPKSERFCKVKDMEHFNLWCAGKKALRNKGAFVGIDRDIKKNHTCLNQYRGYGSWERLEFSTEIYQTGLNFEFFQNVTTPENRNGGRYDFDKYKKFPYLLKLRLKVAVQTLIEAISPLCDATITFTDRPVLSADLVMKDYRQSCHKRKNISSLEDAQLTLSDYDLSQNNNDRDRKKIMCGELKYFYSYDGYLHRGIVYHNLNNMWWVIENDITLSNKASFELFDRTNEPIRRVLDGKKKLEKLMAERGRQIQAENFLRCNSIQKEIDKLKTQIL